MELLEGETLAEKLEHGALPERKAIDLRASNSAGDCRQRIQVRSQSYRMEKGEKPCRMESDLPDLPPFQLLLLQM
jgi:hypothetical protein